MFHGFKFLLLLLRVHYDPQTFSGVFNLLLILQSKESADDVFLEDSCCCHLFLIGFAVILNFIFDLEKFGFVIAGESTVYKIGVEQPSIPFAVSLTTKFAL